MFIKPHIIRFSDGSRPFVGAIGTTKYYMLLDGLDIIWRNVNINRFCIK